MKIHLLFKMTKINNPNTIFCKLVLHWIQNMTLGTQKTIIIEQSLKTIFKKVFG